ncbi:MAG: hypothetical protein RLZZ227_1271 [Pseudomonadota bacterium]|jgi:hypothetical protein
MKRFTSTVLALAALSVFSAGVFTAPAMAAEPEYVTIEMEIDVARPAAEVWSKVGGYCDIAKWLPQLDCAITSGDGGMGTVRVLAGGRIKEILIAQTELSYGYTQPVVEGQFYILYHGFMEARPVTDTTSKMLYTLVFDVSNLADQAAKDADIARRRASFETALTNMKNLAEAE